MDDTPQRPAFRLCRAIDGTMLDMTAGNVHRSEERSAQIAFRTSPDKRREVQRRATEAGMTVQVYMEWRLLGSTPSERPPGRPRREQGELPLTG